MLSSSAATKFPPSTFAFRLARPLCLRVLLSERNSEPDAGSLRISGKMNITDFEKVVSSRVSPRSFFSPPRMEFPTTQLRAFDDEPYLSQLESQSEPLPWCRDKQIGKVAELTKYGTAFWKSTIRSGRGRCHCQAFGTTELVQRPIVRFGSSCRS